MSLPIERLEQLAKRYVELDDLLCQPQVLSDRNRLSRLNKERGELEPIVNQFRLYQTVERKLAEDQAAFSDPELRELVEAEIPELSRQMDELSKALQLMLLPSDPVDTKNTILEIRSGEGGEEAALFAADLFRMYSRYAETQAWKIEILNTSESSTGGFKEVIALVTG
ncbi:MAG TPA: PCRF domain-containing protein, partial [Polyangiaceae bacterium]